MQRTSKTKHRPEEAKRKSKRDELHEMYAIGNSWAKKEETYKETVFVQNGELKLYGEFFDFGFDKAVIIIPGHSKECTYSYYYAEPYKALGFNILVIDNRCNGLSDGKYLTFGIKEYTDILLWGKFLHDNYQIQSILLHGICIGAATALFAMTSTPPSYFIGMIADGIYSTFYEIFLQYVITFHQPLFPVPQVLFFMVKQISKIDAKNTGPAFCIEQLQKPILFIHSIEDKYSLPANAENLFERCTSPKRIAWFEKGSHSHIRINNETYYDQEIGDFIKTLKI